MHPLALRIGLTVVRIIVTFTAEQSK